MAEPGLADRLRHAKAAEAAAVHQFELNDHQRRLIVREHDRLTIWAEILVDGLQSRLLGVLDGHQLGGHIPVIEFSALGASPSSQIR
jgi:hypothetical protein